MIFVGADLPQMDGLECAKIMRCIGVDCPVVLVFGPDDDVSSRFRDAASQQAVTGTMRRPFTGDELYGAVERWFLNSPQPNQHPTRKPGPCPQEGTVRDCHTVTPPFMFHTTDVPTAEDATNIANLLLPACNPHFDNTAASRRGDGPGPGGLGDVLPTGADWDYLVACDGRCGWSFEAGSEENPPSHSDSPPHPQGRFLPVSTSPGPLVAAPVVTCCSYPAAR